MSYLNYSLFDLKTENDNYTQEDVEKVSKLLKEKLSKTEHPEWFIDTIFNSVDKSIEIFNGHIRASGESDNIKHDWSKEFGQCVGLLVNSFRELGYKLEVPETEDCPYWNTDNGPDEEWNTRFELYLNEEDGLVYIDEEGEYEETDNYDDDDDYDDEEE